MMHTFLMNFYSNITVNSDFVFAINQILLTVINLLSTNIDDKGLIGVGAGMATTGCLGAGIGQGFIAGKACESIARNPEAASKVQTLMIIGAAIAESGAIYSLLVALILLFVYGG